MASFIYYNCHPLPQAPEIGLSIFLITGLCVVLPALVWTLSYLYHHHNSGSKVSVFIIFLLLTDALEMVLRLYIVATLLSEEKCYYTSLTCKIITSLWSGARSCGFHFPQLVALESILSLTHPDHSAHIFSRPLSIILSITVFLLVMISSFVFRFHVILSTILFPAHLSIFAILCKLICTAPPSPHVDPKADQKRGLKILAVVMVTYVFLYFPGFVVMHMCFSSGPYGRPYDHSALMINLSLVSLRVIIDSFLCVLVCRENVRRQKPQTELNTDLRSV